MLKYSCRPLLAGLFLFAAARGFCADDPKIENIKQNPKENKIDLPPAIGLPPQGMPPGIGFPHEEIPLPGGHIDPHAVIGVREIGCYHACPTYYSPYHVRPWMEPALAASQVRSQLAHLGIKITPAEKDKDKEKNKDDEKGKDEGKGPKPDK
jgi:hypothetical protein